MTIGIDSSLLLAYMQGRAGLTVGGSATTPAATAAAAQAKAQPTAPWATTSTAPKSPDLVKAALAGHKLIDETAAKLDVAGAGSADYKKLFSLYQGLNALNGLVERMNDKGVSATEKTQIQNTFVKGMAEVTAYAESLKLDNLRLTRGTALNMTAAQLTSTTAFSKADTAVGVPIASLNYVTGVVHTGGANDPEPNLQGSVKFKVIVKKINNTETVPIDLDGMGTTPRTLGNVANYINSRLASVGSVTRFSATKLDNPPNTATVGGKTVTLAPSPDRWALSIKGDIAETVSFSAPATAGAVYMAQTVGKNDDPKTTDIDEAAHTQQLLKFQTDQSSTVDAPPPAVGQPGEAFRVDGRAFVKPLEASVQTVRSTVTGTDGSLYVLADVDGAVSGQTIKGAQDTALLKYDSAGNLIYTRTLGAADQASGLALAVSADGKVAIAGSVTGGLDNGDAGVDATKSDSFVTVFDANGDEMWTQRRAARQEDTATAVSFASDGSVLVAGQARSNMPGADAVGGWDGYLESFTGTKKPLGGYGVTTNFVTQFGTTGTDSVSSMAVDGSTVVTAGVEGGHAVLRRFDLQTSGAPVMGAVRDLGDLQGGGVAGVAFDGGGSVIVAGTTRNGALDAGAITTAYTAGTDAFVAKLGADLTPSGADRLNYFGGVGDDAVTAMTVSDGQVWLAGGAGKDLPGGLDPVGTKAADHDGFLVRIDADNGDVQWGRRFTGQDGQAAPTSIAVDSGGASVLDRLGLPTGAMQHSPSTLLTSATSLRAGDQFQIRTDEGGRAGTVTIAADDTLQTLSSKIQRASNFRVTVQIVKDGAFQRLQVKPINANSTVEILAGKTDRDALAALGMPEGVVRVTPNSSVGDVNKVYGLALPRDLSLDSKADIKTASDTLQAALGTIRTAYRDLATLFNPPAPAAAANTGTVPAYLTQQIANYQDALNRLTGEAEPRLESDTWPA